MSGPAYWHPKFWLGDDGTGTQVAAVWATALEVKEELRNMLADATVNTDRWDVIVNNSVADAMTDLRNAVMTKGYTVAQIEGPPGWDDLRSYSRRRALYLCGVKGAALLTDRDRLTLLHLDPLEAVNGLGLLAIGGVLVAPTGTPVGGVSGGDMRRGDELFPRPYRSRVRPLPAAPTPGGYRIGGIDPDWGVYTPPDWPYYP